MVHLIDPSELDADNNLIDTSKVPRPKPGWLRQVPLTYNKMAALEEDSTSKAFWKPEVGVINRATILMPFIRDMTDYKDPSIENKPQWNTIVITETNPDRPQLWSIKSKPTQRQLRAVLIANKLDLDTIVGATLTVTVSVKPLGKTGKSYDEHTLILEKNGVPTPAKQADLAATFPVNILREACPKYFDIQAAGDHS